MVSIKTLQPPEYTAAERSALIDFVLALKKTHVQGFLKRVELPRSGTKTDLRERLQEALNGGQITYEDLVGFLDTVAPWGKQHVFLYAGPRSDVRKWKDPDAVLETLKSHRVGRLFNARLPLILPEKLTLSSITHLDGRLRVTAVQKRIYAERAPEHDDERESVNGATIILRAYMRHVSRTLVAFEWDLNANAAMLQITQLHSDADYEKVAKEFLGLVNGWLDIDTFGLMDIRRAIPRLHELESTGQAEARSHGMQYRTLRGRRLAALSPSPRDSVLGEAEIDDAMARLRETGVGHLGNFYWLPNGHQEPVSNPLPDEVHVILVADKSRVNFPTPNTEEVVRYVLHRVRSLS